MDMKKILQAFDSATAGDKKSVAGVNDMKKFLSVVSENVNAVDETVISSFDEGSIGGDANAFLIAADNINDEVMGQIEKIKINADPELLKDLMNKFNSFMTAYHAVGKEILQPDMFNDSMGESALDEYGNTAKGQKMLTKVHKRAVDRMIKSDDKKDAKGAKKNQQTANRAWDRFGEKEKYGEGLSFKDYAALVEAKKKMQGSDPCWDNYKMVGTKKKGGKEVPNCVPKK